MTEWPGRPVDSRGARARRRARFGAIAARVGKAGIALVSTTVLAIAWYGWQFIGDLTDEFATTDIGMQAKPLDGSIDILLAGQDSRTDAMGNPLPREVLDTLHAGEADGERQTDTMVLVHIPQNGDRAVALSFPRDSWVDIAGGFGKHKLNSAFAYAYNDTSKTMQEQGEEDLGKIDNQAKIAGRKNLIATIEQFLGVPGMIDRYAEVNLASFYEVTKAIGGIDVCLNNPVHEPKSGVNLPGGEQTVQGVQALAFVRQRYGLPNGDLDRIARQQAFLSGLANKVLSKDVLTSPTKTGELIRAVKKSVVLSHGWDLLEFAQQMRGLTGGKVRFHTIPVQGNTTRGGADVMQVDRDEVRAFVNKVTGVGEGGPNAQSNANQPSSPAPGSSATTVDLFDGSGQPQSADHVRDLLQANGFTGGEDNQLDTRSTTVVRYPRDEQASAESVAALLGNGASAEQDTDVDDGHIRVLLGSDYQPTATSPANAAPQEPQGKPAQGQDDGDESHEQDENAITAGGVPCVN